MSFPFVKPTNQGTNHGTNMGAGQDAFTRLRQGTVLVVDDFDAMRRVTTTQLRQLGIVHSVEAANGAEALKMLLKHPITAILSDWNMPVMNGLEFLLSVRSHPQFFRLPFLMITAEVEKARVMQAIQAGVSELLVKPYSAARFADRLERAMAWKPKDNKPIDPAAAMAGSGLVITRKGGAPLVPGEVAKFAAPLGATAPAAAPVAPADAEFAQQQTILVVDDTAENLQLLSGLFRDDYRVKIAHSGEKALTIAQSDTPPDLILLDIMMPGMDGFEVARKLRAHPASEHIPIVFVTAMTDEASRLRGLELGAVDFVTKPIDPDGLVVRVKNFMRYVALHRRLQDEYDAMMTASRLKEDVERITRHDVKAPLAGVIGLIQGLADAPNLSAEQRETIRMAEEAALQALDLINFTSELYKIETGRFVLRPQPVPVAKILRKITQMQAAAFAVKELALSVVVPPGVTDESLVAQGDPLLCHSMFQNLIKNACEAAPDGTAVTISITPGSAGSPLRAAIANKGVVPAAIRDTFFQKYSTAGKSGGTGIGTYSANMLAQAQHGSLAMETDDAANSTCITVSLPAAPG